MHWLSRWWCRSLLALVLAWVGVVLCLWLWVAAGCPGRCLCESPESICDLPPERVLQVPHGAWLEPEEAIVSSVPVVKLRESAPGQYELLYWGNPIRPRYAYRVLNIMTGESVLLSAAGQVEPHRPLPVLHPRRDDAKLPLQPIQTLGSLAPAHGGFCAARVEVIVPETGVVLCWAEYLLACQALHRSSF